MLKKNNHLYQEDIRNILSVSGVEKLHGKSFLITGATGMVGVMLVDVLMALGDVRVIAVGRNVEKAKDRLGEYFNNSNFKFVEHDVCNPFDESIKVDYIIPAASNIHPLAYSKYPVETMLICLKGVENALSLAEKCGAIVVYTSTNEIYGNAVADEVFSEDSNGRLDLSNSRSCYNEAKRSSEAMCQSYLSEKNVKVKIVRFCRIFGPTMLEDDSKVSSQFIKNAVSNENIVLKSSGNQYFSYTYVADAVAGLLVVLLNGELGVAYNVSSEKTNVHIKNFAKICAEYSGNNIVYERPSEMERSGYSKAINSILSNEKIKSIGYKPLYNIKDAIYRTISMLKDGLK